MDKFADLQSLYSYLEDSALAYKYPHQIARIFRDLRDLKSKENKSDEAQKCQWEVDFFNFMTPDGELVPTFKGTNEKGEVTEYPTFQSFNDQTYEYLIDRLDHSSNPLLRARYSHVLWSSPRKHTRYAEEAIESYLRLIKIYEGNDKKEPHELHGLDVLRVTKNAYSIACQSKSKKIHKVKSEVLRLIRRFNFGSSSSFALRA